MGKKKYFILGGSLLAIMVGVISFLGLMDKIDLSAIQAFLVALVPIGFYALGLSGSILSSTDEESDYTLEERIKNKKIGAAILYPLLIFSLISSLIAFGQGSNPIMVTITILWHLGLQGLLISDYIELKKEQKAEEAEEAEKNKKKQKKEGTANKEKECEDEAEEKPVETKKSVCDQLTKISEQCPNARTSMLTAISQIQELNNLKETLNEFEEVIYKKTTMEALRKTYDKVVAYVEQNLRDILAICIAGQAVKNKKLTQGELKTIERELRSNENKINRYKNDLRKTAESSIQKNDAFTDLDIDSELTAIERFTELKGSETDVFSPTTKPGA